MGGPADLQSLAFRSLDVLCDQVEKSVGSLTQRRRAEAEDHRGPQGQLFGLWP